MTTESSHERKRQKICMVALDIFSTRGFEGTTLEAVAEALDYTKPALYYYFDSKEALFRALVLDSLREALSRIESIRADAKPASEKTYPGPLEVQGCNNACEPGRKAVALHSSYAHQQRTGQHPDGNYSPVGRSVGKFRENGQRGGGKPLRNGRA